MAPMDWHEDRGQQQRRGVGAPGEAQRPYVQLMVCRCDGDRGRQEGG